MHTSGFPSSFKNLNCPEQQTFYFSDGHMPLDFKFGQYDQYINYVVIVFVAVAVVVVVILLNSVQVGSLG
ncbi:MAG: hypothetical protein O7D30_06555 [Rickettsia endosymbiont of Ixodes persulcatus]|nr:hypothetical protein [Rickettsia endosymbiont of Ixodes persulcatus]